MLCRLRISTNAADAATVASFCVFLPLRQLRRLR